MAIEAAEYSHGASGLWCARTSGTTEDTRRTRTWRYLLEHLFQTCPHSALYLWDHGGKWPKNTSPQSPSPCSGRCLPLPTGTPGLFQLSALTKPAHSYCPKLSGQGTADRERRPSPAAPARMQWTTTVAKTWSPPGIQHVQHHWVM